MKCRSGKNSYLTEPEVQEALIRSQITFRSAASNYYLCDDCGEFHLTSQSIEHPLLNDPSTKSRISKERKENEWKDKFRS